MLPILTPSDFVDLTNQTLEFAFPIVTVEGEIKNLKISQGRWLYFDIADKSAKLKCFGTVYNMPGPLEDGMLVRVLSMPRLHELYGFSLNIRSIELSGEGTIKKAADLLKSKLEKEGLFNIDRKRDVPYPPMHIGLITSEESAGYKDFIKVLTSRIGGIEIELANVNVQGASSAIQIINAINWFNEQSKLVEAIVIIRGGGSADDLQVFSMENVVRTVAASRIPIAAAIGHETDLSLVELAADIKASTPSNLAEVLVPERKTLLNDLIKTYVILNNFAEKQVLNQYTEIKNNLLILDESVENLINKHKEKINSYINILESLNPNNVLKRGYSIVRNKGSVVKSINDLEKGNIIDISFSDGSIKAEVN